MRIAELEPRINHPAEVHLATVVRNGCFPPKSYLTTNQVEFFYRDGEWQLPLQPRMDGLVRTEQGERLKVVEMNKLKEGENVIEGSTEDGSEGIYVINLKKVGDNGGQFGFMQSEISRERRVDYPHLASVLRNSKKDNGKIVWVLGPAVVHSGGIESVEWLIQNGYVGALFGGNAIGVHDIEHAMFGTSLGLQDNLVPAKNGHRNHLEAINLVRECGSIKKAVEAGLITHGIMFECIRNNVPFVLVGSIRDDGPLPDTITDNVEAQNAMRVHTIDASAAVMIATVLHSVAAGNMTPSYRVVNDDIQPIPIISVDTSEFASTKLVDRGSGQAYPVITNASNFLSLIVNELAKKN